jgi:hypothetical protein
MSEAGTRLHEFDPMASQAELRGVLGQMLFSWDDAMKRSEALSGGEAALMAKLATEGTKFQAKVQEMLEEYMDGPVADREKMARQIEIAREGMRGYAPALRELAR